MSISIRLGCAMCGTERNFNLDTEKLVPWQGLKATIEKATKGQWIVQYNPPHLDIYCGKVCAR